MSIPIQLKLFHIENPLSMRLGSDFFRALPSVPGVYFFHGKDDELLYIGQSLDLKARIGSYRHVTPEKNPKRTLKLVHRIVRIEWKVQPDVIFHSCLASFLRRVKRNDAAKCQFPNSLGRSRTSIVSEFRLFTS